MEIKNGGVVCSISSAGISGGDPRADARTQLTAAKQNLERVQKLYNSNLATAKELQEAQVAVEMAKNAVSGNSSSSVAVSPISGVVSQLLVA